MTPRMIMHVDADATNYCVYYSVPGPQRRQEELLLVRLNVVLRSSGIGPKPQPPSTTLCRPLNLEGSKNPKTCYAKTLWIFIPRTSQSDPRKPVPNKGNGMIANAGVAAVASTIFVRIALGFWAAKSESGRSRKTVGLEFQCFRFNLQVQVLVGI